MKLIKPNRPFISKEVVVIFVFLQRNINLLKNRYLLYTIIYAFVILLYSCASQSALEGGPKDEKPPVLLTSTPANKSTNFTEKKIILDFDEFVQLKSIQEKLVVSPPMKEKPKVLCKTKSVIITFEDTLLANTTYNLNFSDAIADLNENNSIDNFHFCFSTGQFIDSLKISGKILDAYTQKPENGMFVLLYNDNFDSVPLKNIPFYIGKTNASGMFSIENLRSGKYKIFGLKDANSNLLFDMPNEKIAFSDTLIIPNAINRIQTDTLKEDSIVTSTKTDFSPINLVFYSFEEDRVKQFIKKSDRLLKNKCQIYFNRKGLGKLTVEPITTNKYIADKNNRLDSLTIWLLDSTDYSRDSVKFKISYIKKDTLNRLYDAVDSVTFVYTENAKEPVYIKKETVLTNFQNNQQISYNDLLRLKFSNPVLPLTTDKIILEEAKDSVFHKITPKIIIDSLSSCIYFVSYPWKEEMNYRFRINKDSAKDVYGYSCDSLIKSFKSSATDYYSAVNFSFTGTDNSYVFQIIDAKETVVTEWSGKLPQTKKLDRLNPGKYKLRAFADNNNNGKWDTGCYLEHKQPEKLYFYSEEINLRSNWEIEVKWELKEPL